MLITRLELSLVCYIVENTINWLVLLLTTTILYHRCLHLRVFIVCFVVVVVRRSPRRRRPPRTLTHSLRHRQRRSNAPASATRVSAVPPSISAHRPPASSPLAVDATRASGVGGDYTRQRARTTSDPSRPSNWTKKPPGRIAGRARRDHADATPRVRRFFSSHRPGVALLLLLLLVLMLLLLRSSAMRSTNAHRVCCVCGARALPSTPSACARRFGGGG